LTYRSPVSGRPGPGEFAAYAQSDIDVVEGDEAAGWMRRGEVNGYRASVRGLAFHIAGHELHHHRILRERYLVLIDP